MTNKVNELPELIELDSIIGETFGFTSDKFDGWLFRKGTSIYCSLIVSKHEGKGNFSALVAKIRSVGYLVKVPVPLARMKAVLIHLGFEKQREYNDDASDFCEVWVLK